MEVAPYGCPRVEVEVGARPDVSVRGGVPDIRRRMAVTASPNGSIEISPDLGQELVVLGDEDTVLIVGELPSDE